MPSARALLARVQRLEQARAAPQSPFESAYGSFDAFEEQTRAAMDAGTLDTRDMPIILTCLRRWHEEGAWGLWRRDRIWERCG